MKRLFALGLALMMSLALCACSGEIAKVGGALGGSSPYVGKYLCTSVVMEEVELGGDGEYLDLMNGGKCSFFLYDSPDDGTWSVEGETLTITVPYADMDLTAAGLIQDGIITMTIPELNNATLTFQKEGLEEEQTAAADEEAGAPAEEAPAEADAGETAPAETAE